MAVTTATRNVSMAIAAMGGATMIGAIAATMRMIGQGNVVAGTTKIGTDSAVAGTTMMSADANGVAGRKRSLTLSSTRTSTCDVILMFVGP
ncbi:hypothetical protein ASF57_24215 [Methylobacterium sp. Leaf117]|nr:hypothetical protein ASF57_24215 [Methylobacterium sp. Leaf117]